MPAYVIASPGLREVVPRRWARQRRELAALLPGTRLVSWTDLPAAFHDVSPAERPARLARALGAAVVVPDKLKPGNGHPRRWIGPVALAEAEAFTAAGKPVYVYARGELVPWKECRIVRDAKDGPRWSPVEVVLPRFGANGKGGTVPRPPHPRPAVRQLVGGRAG